MTAYKLTFDDREITRSAAQLMYVEVTNVMRRVLNRAMVLTPVKHGRLRQGNRMRIRRTATGAEGEVFNDTVYADAVHNGTAARVITPRPRTGPPRIIRAKPGKMLRFEIGGRVFYRRQVVQPYRPALRFKVGGKVVYAAKVNMPARKGRPWLLRALKEVAAQSGYRFTASPR